MLEAERRQVSHGSVGMGAKEDESSIGRVWAAGFHHVMAHSCLAHVLKLMTHLFPYFSNIILGHSKPRMTETTDTESADRGARLYILIV
jgi:hypothetical protein